MQLTPERPTDYPLWGARLRFYSDYCHRYFLHRCAFYKGCHTTSQFIVELSGASFFVSLFVTAGGTTPLLEQYWWLYVSVGIVAGIAALAGRILRPSQTASQHEHLAYRAGEISRELKCGTLSRKDMERLWARLNGIDPPEMSKRYIMALCFNEVVANAGLRKEFAIELSPFQRMMQRLFGHVTNIGAQSFAPRRKLDNHPEILLDSFAVVLEKEPNEPRE